MIILDDSVSLRKFHGVEIMVVLDGLSDVKHRRLVRFRRAHRVSNRFCSRQAAVLSQQDVQAEKRKGLVAAGFQEGTRLLL